MRQFFKAAVFTFIATALSLAQFAPIQNATYGGDNVCALHSDTITGITCTNTVTDGSTETAFSTNPVIPAGMLANNIVTVNFIVGSVSASTAPTAVFKIRATSVSGTTLFTGPTTTPASGTGTRVWTCTFASNAAAGASVGVAVDCGPMGIAKGTTIDQNNTVQSGATYTVALATNAAITLVPTITYSANTTGNAAWILGATVASNNGTTVNAHPIFTSSSAFSPAVSSCGTSPSLSTGASDNKGTITLGSGTVTACTLTFGTAFTVAPSCNIESNSNAGQPWISSVSGSAVTFSLPYTGATTLSYSCF